MHRNCTDRWSEDAGITHWKAIYVKLNVKTCGRDHVRVCLLFSFSRTLARRPLHLFGPSSLQIMEGWCSLNPTANVWRFK